MRKSQKILELEKQLAAKERELKNTQFELKCAEGNLKRFEKYVAELKKKTELIPTDCEMGPWCQACAFSKLYSIAKNIHTDNRGNFVVKDDNFYICNKNGSCKNFVPEVKDHVNM